MYYGETFYSGENYDEKQFRTQSTNLTKELEKYNNSSGIFIHETAILCVLIFVLIAQFIFYIFLYKLFRNIRKNSLEASKVVTMKDL